MNVLLNLENGKDIEDAAKERYKELKKDRETQNDVDKDEKVDLLNIFLNETNFSELKKMGMDGSKEMEVIIEKEGEDLSISKSWRSMFKS